MIEPLLQAPSAPHPASEPILNPPAERDAAGLAALGERVQAILGNRFQVLRPTAIGGMATIFQLRHTLHHGLFAAKILHVELTDRPEVVASFRTEAVHAAHLAEHPNAVPVFDFGELDGLFFLIMPWIEGEDLDQILRREGSLKRSDALLLTAQVSSLLCHAEANGMVHGDLTPGNLRLDRFGNYRVLDFGLSHAIDLGVVPAALGGTPLYISPEQAAGRPTDIRSDLYSLGVILFEALTGAPLYPAEDLDELAEKRRLGAWQLPPAIQEDAGLAKLLECLLAASPDDRMQSAFELSGALEAFGFKRPEFRQSLRPTPASSSLNPSRRRRLSPG